MPNIDDLKTESTKFTPGIVQGPSITETQVPTQTSSIKKASTRSTGMGIKQGESTSTIYPNGSAKNMIFSKSTVKPQNQMKVTAVRKEIPNSNSEEREDADFSSIPSMPLDEDYGIIKKESLPKEILGPGGPFEKWKAEKTAEFLETMQQLDEEEELSQFENNTNMENNENDDNISSDEDNEEYNTIPEVNSYRQVGIIEEEDTDNMINQEEVVESLEINDENEFGYLDEEENEEENIEQETTQIEYAKPEEGVSVEAYDNAIEVESVTEENVEPTIEDNNLTRSTVTINVTEDDEEESTVSVSNNDNDDEISKANEILLKNMIKEKITPISSKLDLSTFTIVKKATNSNNIFQSTQAAAAKWVLPMTGITVSMREMSGADLEKLREYISEDPETSNYREGFKIIYDHIVSPKPSYEKWLKTISTYDVEHLFMAVYIASFGEANYIPIDCTNPACRKPYLTENIKIMDMIKFTDEKCKQKFWNLYKSDTIEPNGLYTSEVVPMSDRFAIGFKMPSIYDTFIESRYYSAQFQEKYSTTVGYMPYIDNLYVIDKVNRSLIPIGYTIYDNNIAKTVRSRVMKFDKVLGTLNSDERAVLTVYSSKINEMENWFTYQIPETTCIHCGHVHPVIEDQSPSSMVFIRNRLALLATI